MHWSGALIAGGALAILVAAAACGPVIDRPLRGAVPGTPAPTAPGLPPTLQPAEALRLRALPSPSPGPSSDPPGVSPSPGVGGSPSAVPSPSVVAAPPIVRTIVPGANGSAPPGAPVTISAVLVGRGADLASASLAVDGGDTGAQIDKHTAREWSIHTSQGLSVGPHSARVLVHDASGANGGFTWRFTVGEPPPAPTPQPTP